MTILLILVSAIALLALAFAGVMAACFTSANRNVLTLQDHLIVQLRDRIHRTSALERMLDETRAASTPTITHPALREDAPAPTRRKYADALERELRAIDSEEDRLEYIETIERRLQDDPTLDQDELAHELFA